MRPSTVILRPPTCVAGEDAVLLAWIEEAIDQIDERMSHGQ